MKHTELQSPKQIWELGWPLLVELILGVAIGFLGTLLAAKISDRHAAAFSIANQVFASLFILFRILGAGIGVVLSQHLGAKANSALAVATVAYRASFCFGLLLTLGSLVGAQWFMGLFTQDADLLKLALPYLYCASAALVMDSCVAALSVVLRANQQAKQNLKLVLLTNLTHLILALALFQALGLVGLALGLVASRVVGWLLFHRNTRAFRLQTHLARGEFWIRIREITRIGLPAASENIAWRAAFAYTVALASVWGSEAIATHAYITQINHAILLTGLCIGLTCEIIVGHCVGAGAFKQANVVVKRAMMLGLSLSFVIAVAVALTGPQILRLFTSDAQIIRTGSILLWISVALETGRTFNIIIINALRATGDVKFPVLAGFGSMLLVLAAGSWLLGQHLGYGLVGIWIAYAADEWIRGLIMWVRWLSLGWVKHATHSLRLLRRPNQHKLT